MASEATRITCITYQYGTKKSLFYLTTLFRHGGAGMAVFDPLAVNANPIVFRSAEDEPDEKPRD